jgi:putative transposase
MVSAQEKLSVTKQCALLDIPKSSFYYKPKGVSEEDLQLMALIDKCYVQLPFYGSRRIKGWLKDNDHLVVNRKRIQRLMRQMGIEGVVHSTVR